MLPETVETAFGKVMAFEQGVLCLRFRRSSQSFCEGRLSETVSQSALLRIPFFQTDDKSCREKCTGRRGAGLFGYASGKKREREKTGMALRRFLT